MKLSSNKLPGIALAATLSAGSSIAALAAEWSATELMRMVVKLGSRGPCPVPASG